VLAVVAAVYFTAAILLDFVYLSFVDDAVSRLANGYYVLYSRDPHLAAIGFVWTPLTSIADLVPLLLKGIWPALSTHMFSASFVTIVSMLGAVHQVRCTLEEWGLGRAARLTLTLLFAFNPMMVFFAANGMSEALYVFALVATTRYLLRWTRGEDLRSLVYAATALALGYLARNESALAALLSACFVVWLSYVRSHDVRRVRVMTALTDVSIYIAPFATTFVGWATASYVITRQPFQQFEGNSALVKASGFHPGTITTRLGHELNAMEHLAPLLPIIVVVALVVAWRVRDPEVLVPVAVLGGGLAFSLVAYFTGTLFPWFRYYILTIPIAVLLVGAVLASTGRGAHSVDPTRRATTRKGRARASGGVGAPSRWALGTFGAGAVAFLALAPSIPTSAVGMLSANVGAGETSQNLGFIFHRHLTALDRASKVHYSKVLSIGDYVTSLRLPDGSIVVDNDVICIPDIITTIADGKVFVIPNDRDFQKILADPLTFHARYLLVPAYSNPPDFVSAAFPNLNTPNNGVTVLGHTFTAGGLCPQLRLYRVIGHPTGGAL